MATDDHHDSRSYGPARACLGVITPNNDTDLEHLTTAVAFATSGTLRYDDAAGNTVDIPAGALAPGCLHPLRCARIHSSGTTCTDIVAWY